MYVIPIVAAIVIIAIATAWAPIFALIVAVPLFLLFLAYVGFSRRADQAVPAPGGEPASGQEESGGIWGENNV
jgi:Sec-independent protein secretion pathway component TatC